jgi:hypothetical protein
VSLENRLRGAGTLSALAFLLTCWSLAAFAQDRPSPHAIRPLLLDQNRYRLRAGDRVPIAAAQETLDFIRTAKIRTVRISGAQGRGFVVAPNARGDQVLLAASLTMKPGEYGVTVSAVNVSGEERAAVVDVTLDPMQMVPNGSTVPPVVLLNGWQFLFNPDSGSVGTCPISSGSSDTFGSLETKLTASQSTAVFNLSNGQYVDGAGVPVVYFFDNCVEDPDDLIENLGSVLGDVLNLIRYENGTLVAQVDLVSHSMGGLIVRAYLSGLQTNGALSPPPNPRVRKFIEIATPNFGSFLAANNSVLLATGVQASEMFPGSTFLWNLATWNQYGDDLRGVDALAIVGYAGYWQANDFSSRSPGLSDGVVSITSAALGFASLTYASNPSRTRLLQYCHIDSATLAGALIDCTGGGIADVDEAPDTGAIVLSFLENTSAWQSIGDPNHTEYGGIYTALQNSQDVYSTYQDLNPAYLINAEGTACLLPGGWPSVLYGDFVLPGNDRFEFFSNSLGQVDGSSLVPSGNYVARRFKLGGPVIASVTPLLANGPGLIVPSGGNILINGSGFFAPTTVVYANNVGLTLNSVSDSQISAVLPGTFTGLVQVTVVNAAGFDSINIMATFALAPPFGSFDTPTASSSNVSGSVGFTGWALSSAGISVVDIWREPNPGEPAGLIYIGAANSVTGARPDVQAAYPNYPENASAGWGYLMLTNELPSNNGSPGVGNGTYNIHAIAHDLAGNSTDLGVKTIVVDNKDALAPFGGIDTPSQGGTVSGTAYVNFGWALTPLPAAIPIDGSTIWVYIDNVAVGHPVYDNPRSDIQALFPGLNNTNGAVGYFYIDTTKYANGVHTIAWSVTDNAGHASGIGSRYFTVQN